MEELQEIRRLKEEGLTNPKVLEILEELRSKAAEKPSKKEKEKAEPAAAPVRRVTRKVLEAAPAAARRKASVKEEPEEAPESVPEVEPEVEPEAESEREPEEDQAEHAAESKNGEDEQADQEEKDDAPIAITSADGKSKYSLTCQTCQKVFEHMNPRLRDCLDCYRIKRKERRRGGDKHKNVIQNPLAQQVVNKNQQAQLAQQQQLPEDNELAPPAAITPERVPIRVAEPKKVAVREAINFAPTGTTPPVYQRTQVRSYRKAIEETRGITSNLKRRLERPDLPEAERRFLEQIYAYQLILHQGWKHLSEYRQADSVGSNSGGSSNKHEN